MPAAVMCLCMPDAWRRACCMCWGTLPGRPQTVRGLRRAVRACALAVVAARRCHADSLRARPAEGRWLRAKPCRRPPVHAP